MKQFLLVLDNDQPCFNAIEKAVQCTRSADAFLSVIIIVHSLPASAQAYPFPNDWALTFGDESNQSLEQVSADLLAANKKLLADCCRSANQQFEIIEQRIGLSDLIIRTKFMDCLLCEGKIHPGRHHITDLLTRAYCPVYLIGDHPIPARSVLLAYDGSAACMGAAASYLQLFDKDADFVCLHFSTSGQATPHEKELEDWLLHHQPGGRLVVDNQEPEAGLLHWFSEHPTDLVVMGSYGRNAVSRFFRHSLAARLLEQGGTHLFLSHAPSE